MDINLPGASGVEATRRASQIAPGTAVLVVTMVDDDDTVFAALAAGARGYVLKGASADQITAALRIVAAGGATFGAGVATRLLAQTPGRLPGPASPSRPDDLTMREREVPDLLAEGASNQQIARSLGISLKTVQNHVSRVAGRTQPPCPKSQRPLRTPTAPGSGRPEPGDLAAAHPAYFARLSERILGDQDAHRLERQSRCVTISGRGNRARSAVLYWKSAFGPACWRRPDQVDPRASARPAWPQPGGWQSVSL